MLAKVLRGSWRLSHSSLSTLDYVVADYAIQMSLSTFASFAMHGSSHSYFLRLLKIISGHLSKFSFFGSLRFDCNDFLNLVIPGRF